MSCRRSGKKNAVLVIFNFYEEIGKPSWQENGEMDNHLSGFFH